MLKVYEKGMEIEEEPTYLRLVRVGESIVLRAVGADGNPCSGGNILEVKNGAIRLCSSVGPNLGFKLGKFDNVKVNGLDIADVDTLTVEREVLRTENEKLKAEIAELKKRTMPADEQYAAYPRCDFPDPLDCLYFQQSNMDHAIALKKNSIYILWGEGYVTKDVYGDVGRDLAIALLKNSK